MGEKIKDIGKIHLGGTDLDVELNHGTRQNEKYEIHIQNEKVRLALSEKDFLQMASVVVLAKKTIGYYKKEEIR